MGASTTCRAAFSLVVLSDYKRYMKYLCAHMDARAPSLTGVGFPGLLLGADAARPVLPNDARLPGVLPFGAALSGVLVLMQVFHSIFFCPIAATLPLYGILHMWAKFLSTVYLGRWCAPLLSGLLITPHLVDTVDCPPVVCCTEVCIYAANRI